MRKILHNGSCREQSNIIFSCTIGLICYDRGICYCTRLYFLSNTPQYQFRYNWCHYHRNGPIDSDSFSGFYFRKEDLAIEKQVVPRNNLVTNPVWDNKDCLYIALAISCLFLLLTACVPKNNSTLHGTALRNHDGSTFSLQDENKREVTNLTHIGEVHLLTFLFTNCSSVCPIVTSNIKQAIDKSESTKNIPVLIVSVDPERDTIESRLAFKDRWQVRSNWSYLNGQRELLQAIWSDFYVNPHKSALKNLEEQFNEEYDVIHTSPVFIIGKDGRPAAVHTNPINPNDLYEDILVILQR